MSIESTADTSKVTDRGKDGDNVITEKLSDVRLSIACNYCSRSIATGPKSSRPGSPVDDKSTSSPKDGKDKQGKKGKGSSSSQDKTSPVAVTVSSPIDEPCKCMKPRARCSICLSRLNTSATLHLFRGKTDLDSYGGVKLSSYDTSLSTETSDPVVVRNPFASFTVFCATCRHSGHALHYLDWFKTNNHCPVSGCTCQCSSLDKMIRRESIIHQN